MKKILLLALVIVIILPVAAYGKIMNVQNIMLETDEGFGLGINTAVNWSAGNVDFLSVSFSVGLSYLHEPHLVIGTASGSYQYVIDDESTIESKYIGHLRYRYRIIDFFMMEVFVQAEYDEFKRLKLRSPNGCGLRLQQAFGPFTIAGGISYMYEYMRLSVGDYGDSGNVEHNHVLNSYLVMEYDITEDVSLLNTFYYQPKFINWYDYMLMDEFMVDIGIGSYFSIGLLYGFYYDSRPAETIEKMDNIIETVLSIEI